MSYDTTEAARLISWSNKQAGIAPLTEAELIRWIDDGVGLLEWADIWEEDGEVTKYIDFPTLISLRMICLLHSAGVSIEAINRVSHDLRQEFGTEKPFASKIVWSTHHDDEPNTVNESKVRDLMGQKEGWKYGYWWFKEIKLQKITKVNLQYGEDGIASAWMPLEGIRLDPRFVSGSPCLAGTRIPTWVFPGMVGGGDSKEEIADDYDIADEQVEIALDWERQLADAGT